MRLIFFGSSGFAVPVLKSLLESGHEVLAIVTKSEKPAGRGLKEKPTDIRIFADSNAPGVKLIQPKKLRDTGFHDELRALGADIFVVASFPIMPMEVVNIPAKGCLNVHPSLLPKYRGAAPIRWTLLNGESRTGVSAFFIGGKVDTGSILLQRETGIDPNENHDTLHDRLSFIGAEIALESLTLIESGSFKTILQDESLATPAPKITKEQLLIDWNRPAVEIHNQIRAFSVNPGAYTVLDGKRLKILKGKIDLELKLSPFTGICEKKTMYAGCADDSLEILELQMEGKKRMTAEAFLIGYKKDRMQFKMDYD